jgi:hypothetical protein
MQFKNHITQQYFKNIFYGSGILLKKNKHVLSSHYCSHVLKKLVVRSARMSHCCFSTLDMRYGDVTIYTNSRGAEKRRVSHCSALKNNKPSRTPAFIIREENYYTGVGTTQKLYAKKSRKENLVYLAYVTMLQRRQVSLGQNYGRTLTLNCRNLSPGLSLPKKLARGSLFLSHISHYFSSHQRRQ